MYSINVIMTIIAVVSLFLVAQHPLLREYRQIIYILSTGIVLGTIGTDWINTIYEDYFYITIRYVILQIFST